MLARLYLNLNVLHEQKPQNFIECIGVLKVSVSCHSNFLQGNLCRLMLALFTDEDVTEKG